MKYFFKLILKLLGWKAIEPPVPEKKCIILGVPHTSLWDFVISFLYYHSYGAKANIMIKKSFFWGPLAPIMRGLGGIPVDRERGSSLVRLLVKAFEEREYMHLAIAPEGTRKKVEKWKTGFHTIARAANIPVYLGYFDWGKKHVGRGEKFELSDDAEEDLRRIRKYYLDKGVQGKHKELFSTGKDL